MNGDRVTSGRRSLQEPKHVMPVCLIEREKDGYPDREPYGERSCIQEPNSKNKYYCSQPSKNHITFKISRINGEETKHCHRQLKHVSGNFLDEISR